MKIIGYDVKQIQKMSWGFFPTNVCFVPSRNNFYNSISQFPRYTPTKKFSLFVKYQEFISSNKLHVTHTNGFPSISFLGVRNTHTVRRRSAKAHHIITLSPGRTNLYAKLIYFLPLVSLHNDSVNQLHQYKMMRLIKIQAAITSERERETHYQDRLLNSTHCNYLIVPLCSLLQQ